MAAGILPSSAIVNALLVATIAIFKVRSVLAQLILLKLVGLIVF